MNEYSLKAKAEGVRVTRPRSALSTRPTGRIGG
jgi:hypothetical protein